MEFEEILSSLNNRGIMLDHLSQIEDGKKWSACVRKKGSTKMGYGNGKTIEKAVKEALGKMRDSMDPKGWKDIVRNPEGPKKRKRVRVSRGKR